MRELCVRRLAAVGFEWAANEKRARNVARLAVLRDRRPEGPGRPLDFRASLVRELDYKLYFGGKDGPSPEQYACLALLIRGIGHVRAGQIAAGTDAVSVLEVETEAFKKALIRHGQKTPWFPANKYGVSDGKTVVTGPADDADRVFEKRDAAGQLLYRYGEKRARIRRRGFKAKP